MKVKMSSFVKIVLSLAAFILIIAIISTQIKIRQMKKEHTSVAAARDAMKNSIEELEYELSLSKENYVEKYAREVLGYHIQGEIIFKNSTK